MPISHRFEAEADVCSTQHRVGSLSPPLLESAGPIWILFGAWLPQMEALPACEEIMSPSVAVWPQCTNVSDDRQTTDRPVAIPTHWLASHESAISMTCVTVIFWVYHSKEWNF